LQSLGGNDTLIGASAFGGTFTGTSTGLAGDVIKNFGGGDVIVITNFAFNALTPPILAFNMATGA